MGLVAHMNTKMYDRANDHHTVLHVNTNDSVMQCVCRAVFGTVLDSSLGSHDRFYLFGGGSGPGSPAHTSAAQAVPGCLP